MLSELITSPMRIGVRVTRLWLRAGEQTIALAAHAGGRLIDAARSHGSDSASASDWDAPPSSWDRPPSGWDPAPSSPARKAEPPVAPPPSPDRPAAPAAPPARRSSGAPPAARQPSIAPEGDPAHVSEAPELVEEFAEPGAEDGAGAEVHVDEPWDGYGQMNAKDVVARLTVASPAELAAVQLYERGHRGRQTILAAAERALRSASGNGSRD